MRTLIAAGVMLAPQFGLGVFALDLSVGHIGTSIPLLLVWLLLDKSPPRWYVPVLTAVVLAWVLMADQIVYITGIAPLALVCVVRIIRGLASGTGPWTSRTAGQWYEMSLGAAALAAAGLAWIAHLLLRSVGGFVMAKLPFYFVAPANLHENAPAAWKVLQIFGANYAGLSGVPLVLAFLHLASVIMVASAVLLAAWRFFGGIRLVDQVLAVAIVANVALYLLTNAAVLAAHEVAIIVPFGAALTARMLIRAVSQAGPRGASPGGSGWPASSAGSRSWPGTPPGSAGSSPSPPRRRPTPAWRPGCSSTTSPTGSAATGRAAASPSTATSGSRSGPSCSTRSSATCGWPGRTGTTRSCTTPTSSSWTASRASCTTGSRGP